MPESPVSSVEGSPSTAWPGIFLSLLFGIELRVFLPHCPLLNSFSWGAAPAPRGKKRHGAKLPAHSVSYLLDGFGVFISTFN